jgi:hypothetical protein
MQELGREGEPGGSGMGFAFQQLEGEGQEWQPAFLTSIDHRPSDTIETPTFPPAAQRRDANEPGADPDEDGLDAITPLSEVRRPTFFNRMSVCQSEGNACQSEMLWQVQSST